MRKQLFAILLIFLLVLTIPLNVESNPDKDGFNGSHVFHNGQRYHGNSDWSPFFRDLDMNGVDDLIDDSKNDQENIYVKLDHIPTEDDTALILNFVDSVYYTARYTNTIVLENVQRSLIYSKLRYLDPVVFIEAIPDIVPFLDVSSSNIKVRPNDIYNNVWEELGFTGHGVNIAILDGGSNDDEATLDVAHESLDDMDDDPLTFDSKFIAGWDLEHQQGGELINPHGDPVIGHGTHVAGIALGTGGRDDSEYRGIAPGAQLIDMKVISDAGMGGTIIPALEWCIDNANRDWTTSDTDGIQIVSMSLGLPQSSDGSDTTSLTANRCVEAGIIVVVAAGNDGPNNDGFGAPAAADKVITVGASDDSATINRTDDTVAGFSNRGTREDDGDNDRYDELKPDLIAPGTGIMAPRVDSYAAYVSFDGTSMATPHVSGVIALMLEANPDLTAKQVKDILHDTSEARGDPYDPELSEKYNTDYGYGILDGYRAVKMALNDPVEDPQETDIQIEISEPAQGEEVSGKVEFRGTTSVEGDIIVESVQLQISGEWHEAKGTDVWSYQWNSYEVENGNVTITVQASADNGSEVASVTIKLMVNNTGKEPDEGSDAFIEIEDLKELNEVTGSIIAVVAIIVILAVVLVVRRRKGLSGEDENQNDEEEDEEEEDW